MVGSISMDIIIGQVLQYPKLSTIVKDLKDEAVALKGYLLSKNILYY